MPVRLTRLLSVALISAGISSVVLAAATQSLTWRGDVVTGNGVVKGIAKAWQATGHGSIELQPFNTASGLDAVASGAATGWLPRPNSSLRRLNSTPSPGLATANTSIGASLPPT